MSNTRFVLTNYVDSGTILNGTGGSAPAVDETSPFTMDRTQNGDRYSLWKTGSGASPFLYDIDLGAARAIDVAALLGFSTVPAGDLIILTVSYATSYYPGAWTTFSGTTGAATRDMGLVISAPVTARYWRFSIATGSASAITVGRILLGKTTSYDLGGVHSPGGISTPFQNRIEQQMEDGTFNLNVLGFPGHDFTFPFNKVLAATRTSMRAIAAATGSVVLVDAEDQVYEVIITGGRANGSRDSSNMFNVSLEAKRLP